MCRKRLESFFPWLLFLAIVLPGRQASAQCDPALRADFYFGYVDADRVVFYNQSEGYSRLEWDFGHAEVLQENVQAVLVRLRSDTSRVCLRVWDTEGCSIDYCEEVYPGAPGEMCHWTDCVWPGDANGDGKANNYDLLNIALGYGASGPSRMLFPFQEDPIAWAPNYSDEWDQDLQAVNFKHLDCDGDGYVDEKDIDAIYHNYQPERQWTSEPTPGAPPVFFRFENDRIDVRDQNGAGLEITADLYAGTEALPVDDWVGLAFDLRFPENLIEGGTFRIEAARESFLGVSDAMVSLHKELAGEGRVDLAISRKHNQGRSGNGKIGSVSFVIISDIIINVPEPETPVELTVERMRVVGTDGRERAFDLPEITVRLTLVRDLISSDKPVVGGQAVRLFPNPVREELSITGPGLELRSARLFNLLGQQQGYWELSGPEARLPLADLAAGIYWLQLNTSQGQVLRKFLVEPSP